VKILVLSNRNRVTIKRKSLLFSTYQWRHWGEGADRSRWHHPGGDTLMKVKKIAAGETITWKAGRGWDWWQWLKKVVSFILGKNLGDSISYRTGWYQP